MLTKKLLFSLIVIVCYAIYKVPKLEQNCDNLVIKHEEVINGGPRRVFEFITYSHILEKLLPWISKLKEADKRVFTVGKFYWAFIKLPLLREKRILLTISGYKHSKYFALETANRFLNLRVKIRVKRNHSKTKLRMTIYNMKTYAIFNSTFGIILQYFINDHVKNSMKIVGQMYEDIANLKIT